VIRGRPDLGATRERAAYHEAGHVVVAYYLENTRKIRSVTLAPDGYGCVDFGCDVDPRSLSAAQVHDECMGAMAGLEFEFQQFGAGEITHCEKDREWVNQCAASLHPDDRAREVYLGTVRDELVLFLASCHTQIEEVAQALLDRGSLDHSEIESLLEGRRPLGLPIAGGSLT
jgi:ATP-dependent Zn protease